jgi:hypothetical protein
MAVSFDNVLYDSKNAAKSTFLACNMPLAKAESVDIVSDDPGWAIRKLSDAVPT